MGAVPIFHAGPASRAAQISVVSSPTFGGNIVNSLYRIAGTVVAALWSIGVESAFPGNVAAVVSFTMLFVIPFTYLKLGTTYRKVGLQALSALVSIQLAYMATPSNPGVWSTIYELAYKRTLAIVVGVLVALVVGRVVWPILSRVEMRKTLAKSVRELALIYSLLQGSVEGQLLKLQDEVPAIKALESEAQNHILQTEDFMEMARVEPRLKGPLPMILYDRMLMHAQRVLDQLTLLRTLMMRGAGFELHQDLKVRSMLATAAIEERREQVRPGTPALALHSACLQRTRAPTTVRRLGWAWGAGGACRRTCRPSACSSTFTSSKPRSKTSGPCCTTCRTSHAPCSAPSASGAS